MPEETDKTEEHIARQADRTMHFDQSTCVTIDAVALIDSRYVIRKAGN